MKGLFIFGENSCSHCKQLKDRLNLLDLPYTFIDIEIDDFEYNKIYEETGNDLIPIISIDGEIFLPGKDFNDVDDGIDIIKQYFE